MYQFKGVKQMELFIGAGQNTEIIQYNTFWPLA